MKNECVHCWHFTVGNTTWLKRQGRQRCCWCGRYDTEHGPFAEGAPVDPARYVTQAHQAGGASDG